MYDELIDVLDRQHAYLAKLRGADFFRQLPHFVAFLERTPQIASLLTDQDREARDAVRQRASDDDGLVLVLRHIRIHLAKHFPEVDDSSCLPRGASPDEMPYAYDTSLARFDHVCDEGGGGYDAYFSATGTGDPSRSARLLRILDVKHSQIIHGDDIGRIRSDKRRFADLMTFVKAFKNAEGMCAYSHQAFVLARGSLPGFAMYQLRTLIGAYNPEPTVWVDESDVEASYEALLRDKGWGVPDVVRTALYHHKWGDDVDVKIAGVVESYQAIAERLYQDLRRRIGVGRSSLALVQRFKVRCEWYDRTRLSQVLRSKRKGGEDALVDEMARWMFDQGLTPLARSRRGGLEPDVFDGSRVDPVYVEAKRYASGRRARQVIRRGFAQVCDTVGRLRGSPFEVKEAFFIIFREGGPRYLLPSVVSVEVCRIYPVLVDLGEAAATGSRQRHQPIEVRECELLDARR